MAVTIDTAALTARIAAAAQAGAEKVRSAAQAAFTDAELVAFGLFTLLPNEATGKPVAATAKLEIPPSLVPKVHGASGKDALYAILTAYRPVYCASGEGRPLPGMQAAPYVWLSDRSREGEPASIIIGEKVPGRAKTGVVNREGPFTVARPPATMAEWLALVNGASDEVQAKVQAALTEYATGVALIYDVDKAPADDTPTLNVVG